MSLRKLLARLVKIIKTIVFFQTGAVKLVLKYGGFKELTPPQGSFANISMFPWPLKLKGEAIWLIPQTNQ